ncbi:NAD(P)/FAD-dependent oxidoreductase [Treponema sp.]|uniref:NAD(P)/FAD-dependent oxidoreductase n=1 Tax=Treponema sp. TaxID=166 RepID=UPI00298DC65C|nr:FAD-binding protein [Treponema sp.]MCR5614145.1 FAD-binding protein [Treponema sp.]
MITELSINIKPEEENNKSIIIKKIRTEIFEKKLCKISREDKIEFTVIKKSIDARHKQIKIFLRLKVYINESAESVSHAEQSALPVWRRADSGKSVIIVGSGPAGLFAALKLLEHGIKPIIIERGKDTSSRKRDIAAISTMNIVDQNSNYCFGEGGAGTFSDGKLYTRSNKRGDISSILRIFNYFGADQKILTDAHPHIGTDKLPQIINAMRQKIIELGGEFHFNSLCRDFIIKQNEKSLVPQVVGINVCDLSSKESDCKTNASRAIKADAVLLATGHSATDIYQTLARTCPQALEAKTFAAGVRVEHPRELIDAIQYHGNNPNGVLPTAEYRFTTQVDGRGVYSFCMCPGGFVVPSSSGPDEIVVNGMSAARRNSKWSNAAIVVEVRPEDIPQQFINQAKDAGCSALAGLFFRTSLERLTKDNGSGQAAPAQRLTDFLDHKPSSTLPPSSYTPGLVPSRLDQWLPPHIERRLEQGFKDFNKNARGFITSDATLIASETRTSTPVRILRDKETFECTALKRLYPAGEGSGYSGGIVSSAMDGENAAEQIARVLQ